MLVIRLLDVGIILVCRYIALRTQRFWEKQKKWHKIQGTEIIFLPIASSGHFTVSRFCALDMLKPYTAGQKDAGWLGQGQGTAKECGWAPKRVYVRTLHRCA